YELSSALACRPRAIAFCLYIAGDSHGAHSFPTRRSSDLVSQAGEIEIVVGHNRPLDRVRQGGEVEVAHLHRRNQHLEAHLVDEGDRKSTRLNSSHVAISYAVFCLKKNNVRSDE